MFSFFKIKNFVTNFFKYNKLYIEALSAENNCKAYELSDNVVGKEIVIYGFGEYGVDFFRNSIHSVKVNAIYDKAYKYMNKYVESPDNIIDQRFDYVVITVMDNKLRKSVVNFLLEKNVPKEKFVFVNYVL